MATPRFKMLSQALGAPEEGITYPLGVSPEEQPGLFEEASDVALARENARPQEGYVPAGTGPMVEPSLDSTLTPMPSGLRSRKPVDFTPDTTKMQGKLAGSLGGDRSLASPIPINTAPSGSDAAAPVASTLPATTEKQPAGKPNSAGMPDLPAPSSEGAGSDALGRLSIGQALTRALEGSGSIIAGRDLRSGAADTLGERMKQIEALRAKREERAMELAREDEQSAALVSQYKSLAAQGLVPELSALDRLPPKQAAGLIKTYGSLPGLVQRTEKTKAEIPLVQAKTATEQGKPEIAKGGLEVKRGTLAERERSNKASEAIRWAAMNQASAQAASKLTEGKPDAFRKEVNDKTQVLGTSIAKEYGEIASALQEADRAIVGVRGVSPDMFAKVAQATKMDSLNTPEERALFRSIGELRRAAQKAQSGLAVTEAERQEFLQTFGQNWMQDSTTLLEAIEWMRRKTQDKLNTSFATYRAQGDVGNTAIQAYEQAGGVTPNAEYLKPFSVRAPKTAAAPAPASAAQGGGMVKVRHKASGKTATVDRAKADEMLKRPDFEEVK